MANGSDASRAASLIRGKDASSKETNGGQRKPRAKADAQVALRSGLDRPIRIVSIGEVGGGTVYFGRDNFIGFANWLRDRIAVEQAPDHIFIHGEMLSDVPEWGTRGSRSKALVLSNFVETVDKSVISVKPYLTRVIDQLEKHGLDTGITYVLGPSDKENAKRAGDLIVKMYASLPEQLVKTTEVYRKKIESVAAGISDTTITRDKLLPELEQLRKKLAQARKAGAEAAEKENYERGIANYQKRIAKTEEKVAQDTSELKDYSEIHAAYREVLKIWITDPTRSAEQLMEKLGGTMVLIEMPWLADLIVEARGTESVRLMEDAWKQAKELVEEKIAKLEKTQDKLLGKSEKLTKPSEEHSEARKLVLDGKVRRNEKRLDALEEELKTLNELLGPKLDEFRMAKGAEVAARMELTWKQAKELVEEKIAKLEKIQGGLVESKEGQQKRATNGSESDRLVLSRMIKRNEEKLDALENELKRLNGLLGPTLDSLKAKAMGEAQGDAAEAKLKARMDEIREQMKKADPEKDKSKILALQDEQKSISNRLKKITYERIEETLESAERENQLKIAGGLSFTNNLAAPPRVTKLAQFIGTATVTANLNDAFGRRTRINIVSDDIGTVDVKGIKVKVANKLDTASYAFPSDPESSIRNFLGNNTEEEIDLLLLARSPMAKEGYYPRQNGSPDEVFVVVDPPFVDLGELKKAANKGTKTWFTGVLRHNPSSGFDEIIYDGISFGHTFHTSRALRIHADMEKEFQAGVLAKEVRALVSSPASVMAQLDERDKIEIASKLPSELRKKTGGIIGLLTIAGVDVTDRAQLKELADRIKDPANWNLEKVPLELQGSLAWLADYTKQSGLDRTRRSEIFGVLADAHFGSTGVGVSNHALVKGISTYVRDTAKVSYVLVEVGDNLEGSHKNLNHEINEHNTRTNMARFGSYLTDVKKIPESDPWHKSLMDEYARDLLDKQAILNLNDQAILYSQATTGLRLRAKRDIKISGNHWDKSFPNRDNTEAVTTSESSKARLFELVAAAMHNPKKMEELLANPLFADGDISRRIREFRNDSDSGQGTFEIEGGALVKAVHKASPAGQISRLRPQEILILCGDLHHQKMEILGNRAMFRGKAIRAEDAYPSLIGIPTNSESRGMSFIKMTYDGQNQPLSFETWNVTLGRLTRLGYVRVNPIIREYEASREIDRMPDALPEWQASQGVSKAKSYA